MNKTLLLCFTFFLSWSFIKAQVGIGEPGISPDPSAMLDLQSTSKGFLTPRMTEVERDEIQSPATSLLIYQTDGSVGFYYNAGTPMVPNWQRMGSDENIPGIGHDRIPIDDVEFLNDYAGAPTMYLITEPGSYYLTKNINLADSGLSNENRRGIIIDASNVTLDLNGYSILGDRDEPSDPPSFPSTDTGDSDGIQVFGDEHNISIANGTIANWRRRGITAVATNNAFLSDVTISNVGETGFVLGDHVLFLRCSSFYAGATGFAADSSTYFVNCNASFNGGSGFFGKANSQAISCTSLKNNNHGFKMEDGSIVLGCTSDGNSAQGYSFTGSCTIMNSVADDNGTRGISIEKGLVQECISSNNGGNGIYVASDGATIIKNISHENDVHGIHCDINASNTLVQDNRLIDNDADGLSIGATDCIIISNYAAGNTVQDFTIGAGNTFGPIVNISNAGDISGTANADHQFANFRF